jgi:hypothetical protein
MTLHERDLSGVNQVTTASQQAKVPLGAGDEGESK